MTKTQVAQNLRRAAEYVASGRQEHSCIAADSCGVWREYNELAPERHFCTYHFEYPLGTKDYSCYMMRLDLARNERVMMLLFAACFYETEGVDDI
jgi:hypothetical protein